MCKSSEKRKRESWIVTVRNKGNKGQANIGVGHSFVPVEALTPLTGCVQERGYNRMVLRSVSQERKHHHEILYRHFFPNSEAV